MSVMVLEGPLSTPEMAGLFSESSILQASMDFEAALARAQAQAGLIPHAAARAITSLCRVELYDVNGIVNAAQRSGNLVDPLVSKLTETVALFDPVAASYVHWGCCGQDVLDTALALLGRKALALLDEDLLALCGTLLDLAEQHPATPVLGRALMQPARVVSLRYKLASWLMPLLRSAEALRLRSAAALQLQWGGDVGTQQALGGWSDAVARALSDELRLPLPAMAWQNQRDQYARLGAELGILCGALGKLARDLSLSAQAELQELQMPGVTRALAAAKRSPQRVAGMLACMDQEFERGLGQWPAEVAEWLGLLLSTHGSLCEMCKTAQDLRFNSVRMLDNICGQLDLPFVDSLMLLFAPVIGRSEAKERINIWSEQAMKEHRPLRQGAREYWSSDVSMHSRISASQLEAAFDAHAISRQADECVAGPLLVARAKWRELIDRPAA
ncbi:MAG: 3-carboxy-cis,cis-muconate cycloisomerase [Burkholderiaceae bacterium]|nr:3-carboxy-cis,cis-muconate cycloisomerase [Roseateles sp.]MBV8470684.1 3-carboxy-cis,cis-muconate cycloisomerase [Burkholderiaceae bacterium]